MDLPLPPIEEDSLWMEIEWGSLTHAVLLVLRGYPHVSSVVMAVFVDQGKTHIPPGDRAPVWTASLLLLRAVFVYKPPLCAAVSGAGLFPPVLSGARRGHGALSVPMLCNLCAPSPSVSVCRLPCVAPSTSMRHRHAARTPAGSQALGSLFW